jgi:hypothetical protein
MSEPTTATNAQAAGPEKPKNQFTMDPDNLEAELAKIPLFMTDLPDEENDTLTALQSLVFDGTPEGTPCLSLSFSLCI